MGIHSKFGLTENGTANFRAYEIVRSLEGSLKRLPTDDGDSLMIHKPSFEFPDGHGNAHGLV